MFFAVERASLILSHTQICEPTSGQNDASFRRFQILTVPNTGKLCRAIIPTVSITIWVCLKCFFHNRPYSNTLGEIHPHFQKIVSHWLMQSYTHNCTPCLIVKSMFLPACFSNSHAPLSFWPNHIIFWDAIQFSHYPTRNHTLCLPDKSPSVNISISHHIELYIYTYISRNAAKNDGLKPHVFGLKIVFLKGASPIFTTSSASQGRASVSIPPLSIHRPYTNYIIKRLTICLYNYISNQYVSSPK